MGSERDKAKGAITSTSKDDAELDSAISSAQQYELDSRKQELTHKERLKVMEMGFLGRFFGDAKAAPVAIAFIAMLLGVLLAVGALFASFNSDGAEFWSSNFERSLAFSGACLAYIFGKNSR